MGNENKKVIPAHYSWNSSIFERGVVDPIKRKLGWVDENERPVSLKESATGQELDRMKETAKDAGKIVATGLAFSNPLTASSVMAPLITGSQAYWIASGLKDGYDIVTDPNRRSVMDGAQLALDVSGAVPVFNTLKTGVRMVTPEIQRTLDALKNAESYNIVNGVIKHPLRSIKNIKTIRNLEDGFYTGVPHKEISGQSGIFMDEQFPNYNGTIWTSDNADYARVFANSGQQNGKIFKVLFPKSQKVLDTPASENGSFFGWDQLPFTRTQGGYKISDGTETVTKYFTKRSGYGQHPVQQQTVIPADIARRFNKRLTPEEVFQLTGKNMTTTDNIVSDAAKNGYQRVQFHNIMDGGSVTPNGHWYDEAINENVLLPHTPHFVIPENASKWSLLPKDLNRTVVQSQATPSSGETFLPSELLGDIAVGKRAAGTFFQHPVVQNSEKHNIELAKRLGVNLEPRPSNVSDVVTAPIKTIYIENPENELGNLAQSYYGDPDAVFGIGWTKMSHNDAKGLGLHEMLHRGYYGGPTRPQTATMDYFKSTYAPSREFYKWKVSKLLKPEFQDSYLSILDNGSEAAINLINIGKDLGLKLGAKYPGAAEFDRIIHGYNGNKAFLLEQLNIDTPAGRRHVWDAMTGQYFKQGGILKRVDSDKTRIKTKSFN